LQGAFSFVGKIGSKVGKFLGSKLGLSVGAIGVGTLAGSTLQQPPVSQSTLNNIGGAKNITQNVDVNITSDNAGQVAQDFSSIYPNLVQQLDRGVR